MPGLETLPADLNRRLESLIRFGVVSAVDLDAGRCRAQSGELQTAWLPWLTRRSGTTREWDPPTVGEGCLLLSPSGETAGGIVLVGVASGAHPFPGDSANLWRRVFPDGATEEYDHAGHHYLLAVPDGGSIKLTIGATTLELTGAGVTLTTPHFSGVQS
jgi:phage baseplate assembly protein V